MPVFTHSDYKAYLTDRIQEKGRGERSRIAERIRCHVAYVSQVLNGSAHLSLEQADLLNPYLGHSEDEAEFFLLLVSCGRAGTKSLRDRFHARLAAIRLDRSRLASRLKDKKTLPEEQQATYYGAWYYSAIHLLISIPGFQSQDQIAGCLRLPPSLVAQVLEFLVSTGLAERTGKGFRTGRVSLHLPPDSPWIPRHHTSWRQQAIQAIERPDARNLHYTSVVSMSEKDLPAVRTILVEAIEKIRAVVRASPEEALYCYAADLFDVAVPESGTRPWA